MTGAVPDPAAPSPPQSAVEVEGLHKSFGPVPVLRDVTLRVAPGSMVALLGPSGCGKTTLLRAIAGLERPDAGEVRIAGNVVSSDRRFVPPERRRVGMVFQDWALFPHLSVEANVGYGLSRAERRAGHRVAEALAMVGLAGLGHRLPGTLSGGQQQRVALARALAPRPDVLLLDEPFSNLDTALRVQVRTDVHRLLAAVGITTVFVTHDQEEAFVLGDEVAVMRGGVLVQQGPPSELYSRPADAWVAGFVGDANLVPATATGAIATCAIGAVPLVDDVSGPVDLLLRPEALALRPGDTAMVEVVEYYGHDTVYLVRVDDGPVVRARAGAAPTFRRGDRVAVTYAGGATVAYPSSAAATGPDGDEPVGDLPAAPVTTPG